MVDDGHPGEMGTGPRSRVLDVRCPATVTGPGSRAHGVDVRLGPLLVTVIEAYITVTETL